jgi:hypothetical protein
MLNWRLKRHICTDSVSAVTTVRGYERGHLERMRPVFDYRRAEVREQLMCDVRERRG